MTENSHNYDRTASAASSASQQHPMECVECATVIIKFDKKRNMADFFDGDNPCNLCGKNLSSQPSLLRHMRNVHEVRERTEKKKYIGMTPISKKKKINKDCYDRKVKKKNYAEKGVQTEASLNCKLRRRKKKMDKVTTN